MKVLYRLESVDGIATTVDLARELSIAPSSTTDVIKRMASEKPSLITYTPYHGVKLTHHGKNIALEMVRKHRLIELMLLEIFNYKLEEVHRDAEKLEHAASDLFIEKLSVKLGDPAFDPHGEPIPKSQ